MYWKSGRFKHLAIVCIIVSALQCGLRRRAVTFQFEYLRRLNREKTAAIRGRFNHTVCIRHLDRIADRNSRRRCAISDGVEHSVSDHLPTYKRTCAVVNRHIPCLRPDRFDHMATLPLLGLSLALFLGFRSLRMPRLRLVNAVGGAAFGVYLIHYSYAWREKLWEMLLGALPAGGTPALSLLLAALLVYAACALLDLARRSALEPLYMRLIDRLPPVRREKGAGAR